MFARDKPAVKNSVKKLMVEFNLFLIFFSKLLEVCLFYSILSFFSKHKGPPLS